MSDTEVSVNPPQVFVARQALEVYVRTDGKMELTRGGARRALEIASSITGKAYRRSMNGKRDALADLEVIDEAIRTDRGVDVGPDGRLTLI